VVTASIEKYNGRTAVPPPRLPSTSRRNVYVIDGTTYVIWYNRREKEDVLDRMINSSYTALDCNALAFAIL